MRFSRIKTSDTKRLSKKKLGEYGESLASRYLEKKGYKVIERNFRCSMGEIDIVATRGEMLVFAEVKTRRGTVYGMPGEAIDEKKLLHIKKAAEVYVTTKSTKRNYQRIDLIEVLVFSGIHYIRHTENISI